MFRHHLLQYWLCSKIAPSKLNSITSQLLITLCPKTYQLVVLWEKVLKEKQ